MIMGLGREQYEHVKEGHSPITEHIGTPPPLSVSLTHPKKEKHTAGSDSPAETPVMVVCLHGSPSVNLLQLNRGAACAAPPPSPLLLPRPLFSIRPLPFDGQRGGNRRFTHGREQLTQSKSTKLDNSSRIRSGPILFWAPVMYTST